MASESGPYITVATFCEQVIEDKAGVLSLIRIVDRMEITAQGPAAPEEMPPQIINWFLVLILKSGMARGSHEIKIVTELPSGITIDPVILSAHLEGGNRGKNFVSRLGMKIEEPGIYWFKIYVGDQFYTQVPLEVIYSRMVTPSPPKK